MSQVPDAWEDEWSTNADTSSSATATEAKKPTTKQTKAQKRAAQAEFNRQIWAEAEGPRETNYFLESRNVAPRQQEFRAAPVLLSRKGPIIQKTRPMLSDDMEALRIKANANEESSDDEDDAAAKQKALEDAKIQAAKDREEKQRKYEERRLELFGSAGASNSQGSRPNSRSGGTTPNLTPPTSRSATPQRGGGKRGRGRGNNQNASSRGQQLVQQQLKEVYDPGYAVNPNSTFLMRRERGDQTSRQELRPIRQPIAPDASGRDGGGFLKKHVGGAAVTDV